MKKAENQSDLPEPFYHTPLNPTIPTLSIRLRVEILKLKKQRDEMAQQRNALDIQIAQLDQAILSLEGDAHSSVSTQVSGRISKSLGKLMRDTAASEIRFWMESYPKGTEFTRQQMEARISPTLRYHWGKMLDEWNSTHPDRPIKDNGRDRNQRRYFV